MNMVRKLLTLSLLSAFVHKPFILYTNNPQLFSNAKLANMGIWYRNLSAVKLRDGTHREPAREWCFCRWCRRLLFGFWLALKKIDKERQPPNWMNDWLIDRWVDACRYYCERPLQVVFSKRHADGSALEVMNRSMPSSQAPWPTPNSLSSRFPYSPHYSHSPSSP